MNVDHLRYFLVLTEEMHYGRAAARLNISQSGLSHAIAALERELGAPLFQKCGRGIELGRYGSVLLPEAQRIVGLADRCAQSFRQLHRGVGMLRLRTIPLLIVPSVVRLCRSFKALHPDCDFAFSTGMSNQVLESLREGGCDVGFCSHLAEAPWLDHAEIQRRRMIVAVPVGHPLADRDEVALEDTLAYPHVTYSWLSGQREGIERLFAPVRAQWDIAYQVEDASFIVELVAQGFGIAVMLETPPVFRDDLRLLPLVRPAAERSFYIVRRREAHPNPVVDLFYDYCVQEACKDPSGVP